MYRMIYSGSNLLFGKYYEDKLVQLTGNKYIRREFVSQNTFGCDNSYTNIFEVLDRDKSFYNDLYEEYKFDIEEFMRYTRAIHTIYYIIDELFYISNYRLIYDGSRFCLRHINTRCITLHAFPERYVYFYSINSNDMSHCYYGYSFHFDDAYNIIKKFKDKDDATIFKSYLYHMELPSIHANNERFNELYSKERYVPDNPRSYYKYLMSISDGEVYEYYADMSIYTKYFDRILDSRYMMDDLLDYEFYRKYRHNGNMTLLDYIKTEGAIVNE